MTGSSPDALAIDLRRPAHLLTLAAMLLGLGCLFAALMAHDEAMRVDGPGALQVTAAGELLLIHDSGLHRVSAAGELLASHSFAALGIVGPVSAVAAADDGTVLVADQGQARVLGCRGRQCEPFLMDRNNQPAVLPGRVRLARVGADWWVLAGDQDTGCEFRAFAASGGELAAVLPDCRSAGDIQRVGDRVLFADGKVLRAVTGSGAAATDVLKNLDFGERRTPMAIGVLAGDVWLLVADDMRRDARLVRVELGDADALAAASWQDHMRRRLSLPGENELVDLAVLGEHLLLSETHAFELWQVDRDGTATAFGAPSVRTLLADSRTRQQGLIARYRLLGGAMVLLFVIGLVIAGWDNARRKRSPSAPSASDPVYWLPVEPPETVVGRMAAGYLLPASLLLAVIILPTIYVAVQIPEILSVVVMLQMPLLIGLPLAAAVWWIVEDRRLRHLPLLGIQQGRLLVKQRRDDVPTALAATPEVDGDWLVAGPQRLLWRRHGVPLYAAADIDRVLGAASHWRRWHQIDQQQRRERVLALSVRLAIMAVFLTATLAVSAEPIARAILER